MTRHAKPLVARLTPEQKPTRRDPMLGYFIDEYWGISGSDAAAVELANMMNAGVKLTREIVDHVAKKHNLAHLRNMLREKAPAPTPAPLAKWVYFIRVGDRVKIGTSVNPAQRAVALSLRVKDVIAVMEGDRKVEKSLHAKFAEHRIDDTEWFAWCDEIAHFIDTAADRFTKDHRAYKPGAPEQFRSGYDALAWHLDNGG